MSLILDALNKAEKERSPEDSPSLNSQHHYNVPVEKPFVQTYAVHILAGVAGILIIVVLFLFLKDDAPALKDDAPKAQPAAPSTTHSNTAPGHSPNDSSSLVPAMSAPAPTSNQPVQAVKAPVQPVTPQPRAVHPVTAQVQEKPPTTTAVESAPKNASKVASIYAQPEETAKPKPKPKPTPPPKAPSLADYPHIKYVNDLAYSLQKNIPTLMYKDHKYSKSDSYVVLNNSTWRKGQQVGGGVVLEDIVEDGIVLRKDTLQFKLMAFNSWINM